MSVGNIVDRRSNAYIVEVDVVFEPSWHDNSCKEATEFFQDDNAFSIYDICNTTVEDAIKHCDTYDIPVTVYLYDKGSNPNGILGDDEDFVDPLNVTTTKGE